MSVLKYIFVLLFLCSCETIRFVNHNPADLNYDQTGVSYDSLHHIGLLGLYEYSDPVDIDRICIPGEFTLVYAETYLGIKEFIINLIGGLIGVTVFASDSSPHHIVAFSIWFDALYSPRSVNVTCARNSGSGDSNRIKFSQDRNISSVDDFISFKVLKITQNKAIVRFIGLGPDTNKFTLFDYKKARFKILKRRGSKALIAFKNIDLQIGQDY